MSSQGPTRLTAATVVTALAIVVPAAVWWYFHQRDRRELQELATVQTPAASAVLDGSEELEVSTRDGNRDLAAPAPPPSPKWVQACQAGCGRRALQKCSGCRRGHYCSQECQSKCWLEHKQLCRLFQMAARLSDVVGAVRDDLTVSGQAQLDRFITGLKVEAGRRRASKLHAIATMIEGGGTGGNITEVNLALVLLTCSSRLSGLGDTEAAYMLIERAEELAGSQVDDRAALAVKASALSARAKILIRGVDTRDLGLSLMEECMAIRQRLGVESYELAGAMVNVGGVRSFQGRHREAAAIYGEAADLAERKGYWNVFRMALVNLSNTFEMEQTVIDPAEAKASRTRLVNHIMEKLGRERPDLTCGICLDDFRNGSMADDELSSDPADRIRVLECFHCFHQDCFAEMLRNGTQEGGPTCCHCRGTVQAYVLPPDTEDAGAVTALLPGEMVNRVQSVPAGGSGGGDDDDDDDADGEALHAPDSTPNA